MCLKEQRNVDEMVPNIRNSRQTPMAAILFPWRHFFTIQIDLTVYWRMSIFAEISQLCDVQENHRNLHLLDGFLYYLHFQRIGIEDWTFLYWFLLSVAWPSRVPLASPIQNQTKLQTYGFVWFQFLQKQTKNSNWRPNSKLDCLSLIEW